MSTSLRPGTLLALCLSFLSAAAIAQAQPQKGFEPQVGQQGKDVVWVPTGETLVQKMLDIANVTAKDYVIDLGSGDGRNVIGAARRGAQALGVEYNPDMVELSRRLAREAGVADKAQFVQGDMFEADISRATFYGLFSSKYKLLDDILNPIFDKATAAVRALTGRPPAAKNRRHRKLPRTAQRRGEATASLPSKAS